MNPKLNGKIDQYTGTIWCEDNGSWLLARIDVDMYNFIHLGSINCYKRNPFMIFEDIDAYIHDRRMKYIGRIEELDIESFLAEKNHECNPSQ